MTIREYLRRYPRLTGGVFMFVGIVIAAIFLPQFAARPTMGTLIVLFGAYYAWATTIVPKQPGVTAAPLSIADHFKRTRGLLTRIATPLAIAWIVALDLYPSTLTKGERDAWGIGGGVALIVAAVLLIKGQFKCPRCGSNSKMERRTKLGRWSMDTRSTEEIWDACPHCGVNFNEPYTP